MNELLREHVTRVGFDLSLGKTHIAALVYIDWYGALDEGMDENSNSRNPEWVHAAVHVARKRRPAWNFFVTGAGGLIQRGLVTHNPPPQGVRGRPFRESWQLTRAGELVIELLRESGVYQEYLADLPDPPKVQVQVPAGAAFVMIRGELA